MTDAQLWLSAFLFQALRFILPVANVFTPILHRVIEFVTTLESDKISKVSFYKETTAFVLWLQRRGFDVQVTGHSLGEFHHRCLLGSEAQRVSSQHPLLFCR